ncbi:MAG: glycosyltransferase family 39 protein [Bryobacterales bacterium]
MQRALAALLVVFSAVVLFWRLDGSYLWRDEGTTAVWARLMAESGDWIPWVYDREKQQLLVQAADGHDVNSKLLPAMQSYMQFYVVGASFALFGADEWSARFPLALLGAVTLFVLWRLGRAIFGSSAWALAPPGLAATSIFFLHAARQSRYYVIVILGASLLLLEVYRYLQRPELASTRAFYVRLAAIGFLIYFSNYVSFVSSWTAFGIFVLLTRDRAFIRGFLTLCAVMAPPILVEFFTLHAEFASTFPPPVELPLHEVYQTALVRRMRDYWRALPIVMLLPAAVWLCWRRVELSAPARLLSVIAAILPLLGFVFLGNDFLDLSPSAFWPFALLCLSMPLALFLAWKTLRTPGPWAQIALFAGLLMVVSPLLTIAAAKDKTSPRHYYQILPAAMLVSALAAAGVAQRNQGAGVALLAGMMIWPNLDYMMGGTDEVVQRQYLQDKSYNGPLINYFRQHLRPGDRVAFLRNVKGMPMYFYFPEMRWVGLLDIDAPYNQKFRGRIPDDQFDIDADADWYVFWDPRDEVAKAFSEERYEKVWEYEHEGLLGFWEWGQAPYKRQYVVWKRKGLER